MNPSTTHYSGFSDLQLESELRGQHCKILEEARIKAVHLARTNRPHLYGDNVSSYIGDLQSAYEGMVAHIWQKLQPEISHTEARMLSDETEQKVNELRQKKQDAETELYNTELVMSRNGDSLEEMAKVKPKQKDNGLIPIGIAVAETALNIYAFQLMGDNLIISLLISAGVSGALFLLAKHCAKHLKENSGQGKRNTLIAIGATIIALGVFFIIAKLRAEHLKEDGGMSIHPGILVFLNVLFYAITVWFFFRNTPTPEESVRHEKLHRLKEKTEGLKNMIKELSEEEKTIREDTSKKLKLHLHKPGYAKWLCERVHKWSAETTQAFISLNLMHRQDRSVPDCFESFSGKKIFFNQ